MSPDDRLTADDIQEFQEIYQKLFNEPITEGDARIMGQNLIELYLVLARPLPSEVRARGPLLIDPAGDANWPGGSDPVGERNV